MITRRSLLSWLGGLISAAFTPKVIEKAIASPPAPLSYNDEIAQKVLARLAKRDKWQKDNPELYRERFQKFMADDPLAKKHNATWYVGYSNIEYNDLPENKIKEAVAVTNKLRS